MVWIMNERGVLFTVYIFNKLQNIQYESILYISCIILILPLNFFLIQNILYHPNMADATLLIFGTETPLKHLPHP